MLLSIPILLVTGLGQALKQRVFVKFIILAFIMLMGYMLSDLVAANTLHNMLRGWARVFFVISDILFFSIVMIKDRRSIWWALLGFMLSKLLMEQQFDVELSDLKFRLGWALLYGALALYAFIPKILGSLLLSSAGAGFLIEGARSLGAAPFLSGFLLLFMKNRFQTNKQIIKVLIVGSLALAVLFGMHSYAKTFYQDTRKDSTEGRLHGLMIGLESVIRSPLIGAGSWQHLGRRTYTFSTEARQFGGHSCILQSWVEGGILAALFFLFYFFAVFKCGLYILQNRPRDYISAAGLTLMIMEAWATVNSPFGGDRRVPIGFTVGLLTYFEYEKTKLQLYLSQEKSDS